VDSGVLLKYFNFISQHGKSYASKDHFDHRFEIFKDNLQKIDSHNA